MKYITLLSCLFSQILYAQHTVTNKEFNLTFTFPDTYEKEIDEYQYQENVTYTCTYGDFFLMVETAKYDSAMYHSEADGNIDFDLHYTQKEFIQSTRAVTISSEPITILGYPGREFYYKHQQLDQVTFKRVYIIKNQVIEMTVITPPNLAFSKRIRHFFNTLSLIDIPKRKTPYITYLSEEEIKNRPYSVDFSGESEITNKVVDDYLDKIQVLMESRSLGDAERERLMVIYTPISTKKTIDDRRKWVQDQLNQVPRFKINTEIISTTEIENGLEFIIEYDLMGKRVWDKRRVFFNNKGYYTLSSIQLAGSSESKVTVRFFESFKTK
ncbi:MAG: hypothetical protein MK212_06240 [Saprospiraceae bacterium]|nr:hypothetical protein [Saprospiraceae bacterium]